MTKKELASIFQEVIEVDELQRSQLLVGLDEDQRVELDELLAADQK